MDERMAQMSLFSNGLCSYALDHSAFIPCDSKYVFHCMSICMYKILYNFIYYIILCIYFLPGKSLAFALTCCVGTWSGMVLNAACRFDP